MQQTRPMAKINGKYAYLFDNAIFKFLFRRPVRLNPPPQKSIFTVADAATATNLGVSGTPLIHLCYMFVLFVYCSSMFFLYFSGLKCQDDIFLRRGRMS